MESFGEEGSEEEEEHDLRVVRVTWDGRIQLYAGRSTEDRPALVQRRTGGSGTGVRKSHLCIGLVTPPCYKYYASNAGLGGFA